MFINFLILKFRIANATDDINKDHAIHRNEVPRIGGLGIFLSFLLIIFITRKFTCVECVIFPSLIFLVGFWEDLKKNISAKYRLILQLVISCFAILLFGLKIKSVGFLNLPDPVSIIFTLIALSGFTNALNIIDGLNGLAAGIAVIFMFFLGLTFQNYGYSDFAFFCFLLIACIIGFLIFNFPSGKIFLGDGGAYFLGFVCAFLSIKLVDFVPEVSPWFPFMLGIYPVWEVLFSVYRRLKKNKHPFSPDRLHFHTLVFFRVTRSNSGASLVLLLINFAFSSLAYLMKTCTFCLMIEFFAFVGLYLIIYRRLIKVIKG